MRSQMPSKFRWSNDCDIQQKMRSEPLIGLVHKCVAVDIVQEKKATDSNTMWQSQFVNVARHLSTGPRRLLMLKEGNIFPIPLGWDVGPPIWERQLVTTTARLSENKQMCEEPWNSLFLVKKSVTLIRCDVRRALKALIETVGCVQNVVESGRFSFFPLFFDLVEKKKSHHETELVWRL